jgi:hypothetical protein
MGQPVLVNEVEDLINDLGNFGVIFHCGIFLLYIMRHNRPSRFRRTRQRSVLWVGSRT